MGGIIEVNKASTSHQPLTLPRCHTIGTKTPLLNDSLVLLVCYRMQCGEVNDGVFMNSSSNVVVCCVALEDARRSSVVHSLQCIMHLPK